MLYFLPFVAALLLNCNLLGGGAYFFDLAAALFNLSDFPQYLLVILDEEISERRNTHPRYVRVIQPQEIRGILTVDLILE